MPPRDRRDAMAEAMRYLGKEEPKPTRPALVIEPEIPVDEASQQFERARQRIRATYSVRVQFPYESLHQMVGRMVPGMLVFVMANTGQGKTTFLLDVLDKWAESGVLIDYLGTEQEPDELITKWACLRSGVPAGVAIGNEWDEYQMGAEWQARVERETTALEMEYSEQVKFSPDKFITFSKIEQAAKNAQRRGAHVLFVDHVDRIEVEGKESEYVGLKRLIRRLKELARDCQLVLLVASQMNREARKTDRLGAYRAPQLHQMQGGGSKEQEADIVLGLWRPIRQQAPDEIPDEYKKKLAAAKDGHIPASDILEPNTMAVVLLKHRTHGERDGNRCKLNVTHGRLADIPEKDRYSTTYDGQRRI